MRLFLCVMAFCLIDFETCFDFEGSGDEGSISLTAEELIPFVVRTTPKPKPVHRKKSKKNKLGKKKSRTRVKGKVTLKLKPVDPCKHAQCDQLCVIKGNRSQCGCNRGFKLHTDMKTCIDIDECSDLKGYCEQICINTPGSFHCACRKNYQFQQGSNTSCKAICNPPCLNNGECIGPNHCSCPLGYTEPGCVSMCNPPCANGGTCKRWNICKCTEQFYGPTCQNALCIPECRNGGHCVAPDTCKCPADYHGRRCERAKCVPPCQNRGICLGKNGCLCRRGFIGSRCQTAVRKPCNPHCKDSSNSSSSQTAHELQDSRRMSDCQKGKNCSCSADGKCQQRRCTLVTFPVQRTKLVRMHVPETYVAACNGNSLGKCLYSRLVSKIVPRTVKQLGYRIDCS